ncbi:UMP kinase [bacterium]|nr:UMP kinase [bacterium]
MASPPSAPRRVLLKLSGAAFAGDAGFGFDFPRIEELAQLIVSAAEGLELAIVVGGGNIFRGASAAKFGVDRPAADSAGMLATTINALLFQSLLEAAGRTTRVLTAIEMPPIAEPFIRRRAIRHLEKGRLVILAAGTGNPYFTTDSAAALRAAELGCESLLKATHVDGVYTADPEVKADARLLPKVSYTDFIAKGYGVMDAAAIAICRENHIPVRVFKLSRKGALAGALRGENVGTVIVA